MILASSKWMFSITPFTRQIMPRRLQQLDMNLLVALDVLLEERHVTRAAQRIGLSQPAMSAALARLRDALGDPLLVRSGGQMLPTPRAIALQQPLRHTLEQLERVVAVAEEFDPASSDRRFRVALFDQHGPLLLPTVLGHMARDAPGVKIDLMPMEPDAVRGQLRAGEVDLGLIIDRDPEQGIAKSLAWREEMISMVREGHPMADLDEVGLEDYCAWPHATIRFTDDTRTALDDMLEARGFARDVVLRVPGFNMAPALVVGTDLVMMVPLSSAVHFVEYWPLELVRVEELPVEYDLHFVWSATMEADGAHRWLRSVFEDAASEVRALLGHG